MSLPRTVLVGSALPLLILVGLAGFPAARAAVGLERGQPAPLTPYRALAPVGGSIRAPADPVVEMLAGGPQGADGTRPASYLTVPQQAGSLDPALPAQPWSDVVGPDELVTLRSEGWPCPATLPAGFALLDVRRAPLGSGRSALHLTYGDGLSAVSVFLQRGELDDSALSGLTSRTWGDTEVYVREGRPEVLVWQGGETVITAVGDAGPADLHEVLGALPRQGHDGTLESLQERMGSALAWFRS